MSRSEAALATARALLDIGAVDIRADDPYTLTSGWRSPVYVDCRRILFHPAERRLVCDLAVAAIRDAGPVPEVVAGGETAGIPFAAWIADRLGAPMVYVRKKPKGFGRNARIEGASPEGRNALLVEDLTTDGGSKIGFADALRDAGATCRATFVVFSYGVFPGCRERLAAHGLSLLHLCAWPDVLAALEAGPNPFGAGAVAEARRFLDDPVAWSARHGGVAGAEEAEARRPARQ